MAFPSIAGGFAPRSFAPRFPQLWDRRVYSFAPILGPTGGLAKDFSHWKSDGTLTTTTISTFWQVNNGVWSGHGDGTTNYSVTVGNPGILQFGNNISLSLWFASTSPGTFEYILNKTDASTKGFGCGFGAANFRFIIANGSGVTFFEIGAAHNDGLPHNYVCTYDNANMRVFVDAVEDGSSPHAIANGFVADATSTFSVFGQPSFANGATGNLFDAAIYDRVLSRQEIKLLAIRPGIAYEGRSRRRLIHAAAPATTITISSPTQYTLFQQSGSTGSIPISGTYSGPTVPTTIEANFNGGAYATIVASPSGGVYSGTLTGQTHGRGTVNVRFSNDHTVTAAVNNIGIGDLFINIGDSISQGRGTNAQTDPDGISSSWWTSAWHAPGDPTSAGTANGSQWPQLANLLELQLGYPVAFVGTGAGSTYLYNPSNSSLDWQPGDPQFTGAESSINSSCSGNFKALLCHLTANDQGLSPDPTIATIKTKAAAMCNQFATDYSGQNTVFAQLGGGVGGTRNAIDNCRQGVSQSWGANHILRGPVLYTQGPEHPDTDAKLLVYSQRWFAALMDAFYSGTTGRGPVISTCTYDSSQTAITITFNANLKTGLTMNPAAFLVTGNGTPVVPTAVVYGTNAKSCVLQFSSAVATPILVSLGSADDANGLVVPAGTDYTLPSGGPINLPAEPFIQQAVSAQTGTSGAIGNNFRGGFVN